MMRALHESNIHNQGDAKEYVGSMFRSKFYELPEWKSNNEVCDFLIRFEIQLICYKLINLKSM